MTTTSFKRVALIPAEYFEALEAKKITKDQFIELCLMESWAAFNQSRCVRSFSAERIGRVFGAAKTDKNALSVIRRQVRELMERGYFKRDYQKGHARPYDIWLRHWDTSDYVLNILSTHKTAQVTEIDGDPVTVGTPDEVTEDLGASAEEPAASADQDRCDVTDESDDAVIDEPNAKCALKTTHLKITDGHNGQKEESKTNEKAACNSKDEADAERLSDFLSALTDGFFRPAPWFFPILKNYSAAEIEFSIVSWMFGKVHEGEPSTQAISYWLDNNGIQSEIRLRRRYGGSPDVPNLTPPATWKVALQQITENMKQADVPPENAVMGVGR